MAATAIGPIIRGPAMVFLFAAFLLAGNEARTSDDIACTDLIQALQEVEQAFSGYQVDCDYDIRQMSLETRRLVSLEQHVSYTVDAVGRARVEARGETTSSGDRVRPQQSVAVYDGKSLRKMEGVDRYARATVNNRPWEAFGWGNPRSFVTHFDDDPVSGLLKEHGCTIVGETEFQQRPVLTVETGTIADVGGKKERKFQFLIDPARNFAIVRRARLVRFLPDGPWKDEIVIQGSRFKRVPQGIWLPGRVVWESYTYRGPEDDGRLFYRRDISCQAWKVNPEVAEDVFTLDFPPNLLVSDKTTGQTYRSAEVTDQMLADQAARAAPQPGKGESGLNWWLIAALGLVPVAAVVGWLLWRRSGAA